MKRITKTSELTYNNVIGRIKVYLEANTPFFFGAKIVHRYAVPRRILFNSQDPDLSQDWGDYFNYQIYRATIACIDYQRAIVGYKIEPYGHYCVSQCYTTKDLLNAVKHAKKHKQTYIIDLRTGKLIDTNG